MWHTDDKQLDGHMVQSEAGENLGRVKGGVLKPGPLLRDWHADELRARGFYQETMTDPAAPDVAPVKPKRKKGDDAKAGE